MTKQFLKELQAKVKSGFDNYRLSTLFSLPLALLLMSISIGVSAALGIEDLVKTSAWIVDLIIIPAFIGRLVSASSYLARLRDAWSLRERRAYQPLKLVVATSFYSKVPAERRIGNWERWGTIVGVLLGIAVGVSAVVLHASVPFFASLWYVAYPLYVGGFIGIFGGLFNRLGVGADNNRDPVELVLMVLAAALGFALGVALFASSSALLATISGVTPFIAGASFPTLVAGAIFVLIAASVYASAADYIGKSFSYLRAFWDESFNKKNIQPKKYEYGASLVGVLTGLGVGLALVLTLPMGSGVIAVGVGSLVVLTAVGVIGGLFARTARLADRLWGEGAELAQQAAKESASQLPRRSPANKLSFAETVGRASPVSPVQAVSPGSQSSENSGAGEYTPEKSP